MLSAKAEMLNSGALTKKLPPRLSSPRAAADTNKHEQQRPAPDLSGRSAEAQARLTIVDGPL
ncbi:hypothetical protein [Streptomyces aureus]|uniref:hypothetical protein n=1 Tax=Streptomyces aureus TaxID=193461 RepID=UPI0031D5D31E